MGVQKLQHENFETPEIRSAKTWMVRQERFALADDSLQAAVGGRQFAILDYSASGVALLMDEPPNLPNCIVSLQYMDEPFHDLPARLVRATELPNGGYRVAYEFQGGLLPIDVMQGLSIAMNIFRENQVELFPSVSDEVRVQTLLIRDFLEGIERIAREIEKQLKAAGMAPNHYESVESAVVENMRHKVAPIIDNLFECYGNIVNQLAPEQRTEAYEYIRAKLGPIVYRAPFSQRSYNKPSGYAGDYQMMTMIYHWDKGESCDLFTKCLNRYYTTRPAAEAVKNRAEYLKEKIIRAVRAGKAAGRPVRIMSVASGPARELGLALRELQQENLANVEFFLIDQDLESLQFAQRELRTLCFELGIEPKITFDNRAIRNIIRSGFSDADFDLIYSAGLFDYFSDPVALMAARRIFAALRPGGCAIIGNFDVANPGRMQMDIILDWQLIYRSEEDLIRLYGSVTPDITVEREAVGINLFALLERLE